MKLKESSWLHASNRVMSHQECGDWVGERPESSHLTGHTQLIVLLTLVKKKLQEASLPRFQL